MVTENLAVSAEGWLLKKNGCHDYEKDYLNKIE
jgi:hypothetical protein